MVGQIGGRESGNALWTENRLRVSLNDDDEDGKKKKQAKAELSHAGTRTPCGPRLDDYPNLGSSR